MEEHRILGSQTSWEFDGKTLTVAGTGKMPDFNEKVAVGEEYYAKIPWKRFRGEIETVVISQGVLLVSGGAFHGCTNLEKVLMPSVLQISPGAFYDCANLKTVIMPETIAIGNGAFSRCGSLEKIMREENGASKRLSSLLFIDDFAFADCRKLEKVIFDNLKALGEGAFANCSSLKSFSAERLYSIQRLAFMGCTSLEECRIRKGCLIDEKAFIGAAISKPTKQIEKQGASL